MTADWPQIDAAAVSASSDLFGGDLFGDELMDMYNSSAVVGSDGADHGAIDSISDIPALSVKPSAVTSSDIHANHPGAQVDALDGLGAFRPSTSFSDFGTLLESDPKASESKASPASAVKPAKKSSGGILSPSPAKMSGNKSGSSGSAKKRTRPSSSKASAKVDSGGSATKKKKSTSASGKKNGESKATPSSSIVHPISPTVGTGQLKQQQSVNTNSVTNAPVKKGIKFGPSPASVAKAAAAASKAGATKNANGSICNPLTPNSKAALKTKAANASSAAISAVSAAASAKTLSTARRLVSSETATSAIKTPPVVPSSVPSSTVASASNTDPPVTAAARAAAAGTASQAAAAAAAASKHSNNKDLTEQDFRGVAQAAVKNLMMSVGGNKNGSAPAPAPTTTSSVVSAPPPAAKGIATIGGKPINTSSAHIAALTSSNWVQACSEGVGDAAQAAALAAAAAANDPAQSKAARARRANLTPDERARQNRDRNREHARNTRLRKKAYVEELKKTLTELVAQRDASELERRHEAQRDLEVREVRFRVMEEFLKLRSQGDNASLHTRWIAIMEDGFTLTIPRTDFRPTVSTNTSARRAVSIDGSSSSMIMNPIEQVLKGPNEVIEDAAHLAAFVNTFGNASNTNTTGPVRFAYHCERKNFMMDGVNAILHWTASTSGAVAKGAPSELVVKGMMKANFSPASNKLNSAELLFDGGSVMAQAKNLITTPTVVTTSQILNMPSVDNSSSAADAAVNEADALIDSIQMPHVPSTSGSMSTRVSTASFVEESTPAVSSGDESEAVEGRPATRRSARVH